MTQMNELLKGGWMLLPLAACSVVAITVIIERFVFFHRMAAVQQAETILDLVSNRRTGEAMALAEKSSSPLGRVLSAGLSNHQQAVKAMAAAGVSELAAMRRGLPALDTIITLSPLLGLLGTIIGMIDSFQIMALSGMGQPRAVTGGVAEALIATATGITVAVMTLIPYNYFLARIEREAEFIEYYATRLEMFVALPEKE
jgi:biopolymer transport protein ExbB